MRSGRQSIRLAIVAVILLAASLLAHNVSHGEAVVARQPLRGLPDHLASWQGEERALPREILDVVRASDLVNRLYRDPAGDPILLYVGYYESQRTGSTIHSPKNCLPGSGWEPIHTGLAMIPLQGGRQIPVNEAVIQRDQQKELVFYWYQGRGRIIADEYAGKFWMVADAISRNRTDGALIRMITPMDDGASEARRRLTNFAQVLVPHLDEFIPQ
jgi:EpsI family protein